MIKLKYHQGERRDFYHIKNDTEAECSHCSVIFEKNSKNIKNYAGHGYLCDDCKILVENINTEFPSVLKNCRKDKRLSQTGLAQKTSLQPSAISHFESGSRKPSFYNIIKLANALEVSADYLLGREVINTKTIIKMKKYKVSILSKGIHFFADKDNFMCNSSINKTLSKGIKPLNDKDIQDCFINDHHTAKQIYDKNNDGFIQLREYDGSNNWKNFTILNTKTRKIK